MPKNTSRPEVPDARLGKLVQAVREAMSDPATADHPEVKNAQFWLSLANDALTGPLGPDKLRAIQGMFDAGFEALARIKSK